MNWLKIGDHLVNLSQFKNLEKIECFGETIIIRYDGGRSREFRQPNDIVARGIYLDICKQLQIDYKDN